MKTSFLGFTSANFSVVKARPELCRMYLAWLPAVLQCCMQLQAGPGVIVPIKWTSASRTSRGMGASSPPRYSAMGHRQY